ncbi:MAG: hypothetical protein ACNS60_07270 [Candidatus Cyclobacteriaceae bacterium M2_1C_046]
MKHILTTITLTVLSFLVLAPLNVSAQEKYGRTLNIALGIGGHTGYTGYADRTIPVVNINYEFDVAQNFTLAPFISFYTYSARHDNYTYRENVVPIGIKGTYYFDELLNAGSDWDFYGAGSVGFVFVDSRWDSGYDGDRYYFNKGNSLLLDIHIGAEYHINSKFGVFLDLSSGTSTIGIAIHH